MLVAYGLTGLQMINSSRLKAETNTAVGRQETIFVQAGCLGVNRKLGEFALDLCDDGKTGKHRQNQ
ncbi:hypothetical protein Cflav_PD0008 [Pedosphaera parvula Ellin514]|uniref:Uncharacterized protein n=1 Tax=Pedosphaera parvula (strain Ellin514) TaxID=320771 RepID=B9XT46_PEDPL|nr:hypothetical protein Cflav_PD0008 [Pedosphaera parvula Ellin514]